VAGDQRIDGENITQARHRVDGYDTMSLMPAAEIGSRHSIACAVFSSSFNTIYLPVDVALRDGFVPADASIAV